MKAAGGRRIPAGVCTLGFVSLLMDTSSELIHALLPLYMVGALGASVLVVGVMDQQRVLADLVDVDHLDPARGIPDDAAVAADAEPDRLAVFEPDGDLVLAGGVLQRLEGTVVEDVAVLVDLHQRGARVDRRCLQDLLAALGDYRRAARGGGGDPPRVHSGAGVVRAGDGGGTVKVRAS